MHKILKMLAGGDRRSIGRSNEVVALALREPKLVDILFSGILLHDPSIRMRCADAAEKVTAIQPAHLIPYKKMLLGPLSQIQQPEVRWHIAAMLARLPLSGTEQRAAVGVLNSFLNDRSSIVKTMAMQALFDLTKKDESLRPRVRRLIQKSVANGAPSMQARGEKIMVEFGRQTPRWNARRSAGFSQ